MNEIKKASPLYWPDGWPRTRKVDVAPSRFLRSGRVKDGDNYKSRPRTHSMDEATAHLMGEMSRMGAEDVLLSTNVRLRRDGLPMSNQGQPDDRGPAVYFELDGKQCSLAFDKWNRVEDNVWAIANHIESLRGQARWGVGTVEQAFRGYMALPEKSGGESWWEILGVAMNASEEQINEAFKKLAQTAHPDRGGTHEAFDRIAKARDAAVRNIPNIKA